MTSWVRPVLVITDDVEPWERLHGETARAFAAFVEYRDMGAQRSLRAVARNRGVTASSLADWSKHNRWVERAEAWDRYLDAEKRRAIVRRQEQALNDQATVAQGLIGLIAQRISGTAASIRPEQIKPGDIPRWLIAAATVQRAALGIPTQIRTEGRMTIDGKLQVEDLTAADRLASQFDAYLTGFHDHDRGAPEELDDEAARGAD